MYDSIKRRQLDLLWTSYQSSDDKPALVLNGPVAQSLALDFGPRGGSPVPADSVQHQTHRQRPERGQQVDEGLLGEQQHAQDGGDGRDSKAERQAEGTLGLRVAKAQDHYREADHQVLVEAGGNVQQDQLCEGPRYPQQKYQSAG